MNQKNKQTLIAALLLMSALGIALVQIWGIPLKDMVASAVAIGLYTVLIAVYLLRFALIFLGVFAVYRILREQHNKHLVS